MAKQTEILDLIDRWFEEIDAQEEKHSAYIYQTSKKTSRVGGRARRVLIKLLNLGV